MQSIWMILFVQVLLGAVPAYAQKQLTQKQGEELLLNIPDAVASKAKGGCPTLYLLWLNEKQSNIVFSMRNPCDKSGAASNSMGIYTVDLPRGEIWSGVDRPDDARKLIDSPRLKELRNRFLGLTR